MDETKVIRIVVDSSRAVDGSAAATRALAALERQTASVDQTLGRMEAGIVRVGGFLKAQLALYAAEAATRLLDLGRRSLEAAAGLDELAEQLGINATALQALQFSAAQNGVKFEQLETGIGKFSQKMGEAAEGSKEVIEKLTALGVKNLDLQGQLRPTGDLLADVANKILSIEDPARRAATMVDLFGKSGTRMLPMLKDLAQGMDFMAARAKAAGAMISAETIAKLDALSDASERSHLRVRALFAENAAGPLTAILDFLTTRMENLARIIGGVKDNWASILALAMNPSSAVGLVVGSALAPSPLDAARSTLESKQKEIDGLQRSLNNGDLGPRGQRAQRDRIASAQRDMADAQAKIWSEEARLDRIASNPADPDNIGIRVAPPGGAGTSTIKPTGGGGGQSPAEKYARLTAELGAAARAQDLMTAAAERGGAALRDTEVHAEALAKAVDIFGASISDADPRVAEIEKRLRAVAEGKAAQAFAAETAELRQQNEVLEAQNRLTNEAPEIQARELALIKTKHEALKDGIALDSDRYKARLAAVELNERLKTQGEQLKNAAALWSEPVIQGFRNIQTAGADAWETILDTGNISLRSLGDVATKTLRRMAAEFLALATIRPVMTMAIEAIGPGGLGLVGGNTMAQLGVTGGGSGGGGLGSILGGGGVGSIFSSGGASGGGWLARQLSGIGDFLGSPVSSLFGASAAPAGGFSNVGSLLASGQTGASAAATGGLSIGGALGGIGSIGMGAYGLLSGKGGTASTIGSIGQIAGGVMMMVPGLQPFGAALSLLSGILPGLFGGDGPKIPPQPALAYGAGQFRATGPGGYTYGGDSLGSGTPMNDAARSIATSLQRSFRAAGLSAVPGALIGGNIASGMDHVLQGGQWQDRPYTQTGLMLPGGGYESLTYNDSSRTPDQAGEYLLAQTFRANVLRGGVSGAGAGLRAGLQTINPTTSADLDRVVSLGTAYDRLGEAINPAKEALDQINASFDDLKDFATEAGLALEPINETLKKQSTRSAQDFIDAMLDPAAVAQRALADERESALESARYIRDNFRDVHVDMDRIATYYTNKEAALRDQFYQGAVTNLQALIDRLTYGDLANASPTLQFSGTRAAYNAALAQARAGDATAIGNLSGYAESYLNVSRQSFASSPEYQALVEQIRAALQEVQISITGGASPTGGTTPAEQSVAGQQISQLLAMLRESEEGRAQDRREMAELRDLMQRIATNRAA